MKALLISFAAGALFAVGLVLSGMTNPQKVRGFLDILGSWDPSLAFVMLGAIGWNFLAFRKIRQSKPLCGDTHHLPDKTAIDGKLILGSALFGIGWGLLGICPGPGIVNLATGEGNAFLFIAAMTVGMLLFRWVDRSRP